MEHYLALFDPKIAPLRMALAIRVLFALKKITHVLFLFKRKPIFK